MSYSLTIPSSIGGDPVTGIGAYAFSYSFVTSLSLPAGVTTIGDYAFRGTLGLTQLSLPSGLQTIGVYAFAGSGLNAVAIPGGVTAIGDDAFSACPNLASVALPAGITTMGDEIFSYCYRLTKVQLDPQLTNLGTGTFAGCLSLTSVTLPAGLPEIPSGEFAGTGLVSIRIPGTVTSIGDDAFGDCGSLTLIVFLGKLPALGAWISGQSPFATVYYPDNQPNYYIDLLLDGMTVNLFSPSAPARPVRLINISTRALVGFGTTSELIPGFVVEGSGREVVLIRAVGPGLTAFGVPGVLTEPTLTVVDSNGATWGSNTGWDSGKNAPVIASVAASVGAFALEPQSNDSALIVSLPPGAYTVQVSGADDGSGVALAEVYEVTYSDATTHLANLSTRAQVGTGSDIVISGFVVAGRGTEDVLVRADGPALVPFGVTGVLSLPSLTVFAQASGAAVGSDTGWDTGPSASQLVGASASVGAFSLASGSADSALLLNLQPGAYTMQVAGVSGTTGTALAEVYELP